MNEEETIFPFFPIPRLLLREESNWLFICLGCLLFSPPLFFTLQNLIPSNSGESEIRRRRMQHNTLTLSLSLPLSVAIKITGLNVGISGRKRASLKGKGSSISLLYSIIGMALWVHAFILSSSQISILFLWFLQLQHNNTSLNHWVNAASTTSWLACYMLCIISFDPFLHPETPTTATRNSLQNFGLDGC